MWILSFIPDAVLQFAILCVLFIGAGLYLVSFFFRFVPAPLIYQLAPYKTLMHIVGIVLMVAGVYFYGGYGVEVEWRKKVKEAQEQIVAAEKKSEEANLALDAERKKKKAVITQTRVVIQERIKEVEKRIDTECKAVDIEAIRILNDASKTPIKKGEHKPEGDKK